MKTFMNMLASIPMPAIADESTDVLMSSRTEHCYATITDTNDYYSDEYRREKAMELRDITMELIKRGAIREMPTVIADVIAKYLA